jgi:hypothetical protein
MDFDGGAAVGAGLIGGAVMGMLLYMGIGMMPRQMKMNLFLMLGTMMFRDRTMAIVAGGMMHAMMSIIFGLIHVAFFVAFDLETGLVAWGILFGFVHWMISGMGLGMMPMMHPLIKSGEMDSPGAFALNYPSMTAMGFFMLHIVFGVLVGALYTAFT